MTKQKMRYRDERWFEELTLPVKVKEDLTREADEAYEQQMEQYAVEQAEKAFADAAQRRLEGQATAAAGQALAMTPPVPPVVIGAPSLKGQGKRITLIEPELIRMMHTRLTAVGMADKQRRENLVKTMQHVAARGPYRVVHRQEDWGPSLDRLREAHANFAPVIDLIDRELTLAGSEGPLVLPPMLLNGPPGCGKTFFAQHLADFFGTGFERVSMETAQTSAELAGTAAYWSNTQPGRIFNRLNSLMSEHGSYCSYRIYLRGEEVAAD